MPALRRMHVPRRRNTPGRAGTMFPHTVTVYNVEVSTDKETFQSRTVNHITLLRGVLLEAVKAVNVRASGLEGADAVDLYIPFAVKAFDGLTGAEKTYLPPVEFWRSEEKEKHWTLAITAKGSSLDGYTFFVKGEALPPEGVKPALVAEVVEAAYDGSYHITKIDTKDYGSPDMQHWEVGGV